MQAMIEELLDEEDFENYETSAFARPGQRCRHNLNYWEFGDYLGIGAGAHGKISFPDRITRHERPKPPASYLKGDPMKETRIEPAELPFEFMLNALRLVDGFPSALFQERTGLPLTMIASHLKAAEEKGLLERDLRRVRPTPMGRRFLNDLLQEFLK
jgi:oxygen-independent coproporphyrinogen-3 oxidase